MVGSTKSQGWVLVGKWCAVQLSRTAWDETVLPYTPRFSANCSPLPFASSLDTSSKAAPIFQEAVLDARLGKPRNFFFFFRPSAFALQCFFVPAPKIMGQTCISLFRWLPLFTPRLIAAFISLINLAVRLWLVDWADKMCCYSEPGRSLFHDITPPFAGRPSSREKWSRFSRETGGGEHIQSITRHLLQSNQLSSAPIDCIHMCDIWIALC